MSSHRIATPGPLRVLTWHLVAYKRFWKANVLSGLVQPAVRFHRLRPPAVADADFSACERAQHEACKDSDERSGSHPGSKNPRALHDGCSRSGMGCRPGLADHGQRDVSRMV